MKALRALLASMLGAALEYHPIWFIPFSRASCDRKTEPNVTVMTLSCVATLSQGVFSPRDTIWRDKLGWFCVWGEFRGSKIRIFPARQGNLLTFFRQQLLARNLYMLAGIRTFWPDKTGPGAEKFGKTLCHCGKMLDFALPQTLSNYRGSHTE